MEQMKVQRMYDILTASSAAHWVLESRDKEATY